ncbi:MAG: hypothetical protein IJL07_07665 [Lachnospiraceae bacterium]|nr:hypothetical protein [Lachnospiraceae bacterium]
MNREEIRKHYEENMYGVWREGEKVTYELLGPDKTPENEEKPPFFFEVRGGELVRVTVEANGRKASFVFHAFLPGEKGAADSVEYPKGSPFIVCMHPIFPVDYALSKGYALLVTDTREIASDDISRKGAFYDIYPYTDDPAEQTGVLMAWAWGASKVLDAVIAGVADEFALDPDAAMVTGVSRWGKATAVCGAFDRRFRMSIPACSGAGGLALYNYFSEGKTYDLSTIGGPKEYTYTKNEPLDCLQSDAERGWFNDKFLEYRDPSQIPIDQENLLIMAMDKDRYTFVIAACMSEDWVNAPSMWECFKKADEAYKVAGLDDRLVAHFHREGHAVLEEDMALLIEYFNHMHYGMESKTPLESLKTTVFAGQE